MDKSVSTGEGCFRTIPIQAVPVTSSSSFSLCQVKQQQAASSYQYTPSNQTHQIKFPKPLSQSLLSNPYTKQTISTHVSKLIPSRSPPTMTKKLKSPLLPCQNLQPNPTNPSQYFTFPHVAGLTSLPSKNQTIQTTTSLLKQNLALLPTISHQITSPQFPLFNNLLSPANLTQQLTSPKVSWLTNLSSSSIQAQQISSPHFSEILRAPLRDLTNLPTPPTQTQQLSSPNVSGLSNLSSSSIQTDSPQGSDLTNLPAPSTQTQHLTSPKVSGFTNLPSTSIQSTSPQVSDITNLPTPTNQTQQLTSPKVSVPTFDFEELQIGISFHNYVEAETYMRKWCDKNKLPMIKRDSFKGSEIRPGRILFECPHRTKRKQKVKGVRKRQHLNFTNCESQVSLYQSLSDGVFKVTKCIKTHCGHLTGDSVYGSYPTVRVLTEGGTQKLNQLEGIGASRRRVAEVMGEETGHLYGSKDIYNRVMKIRKTLADGGSLEKYLMDIQTEGGSVKWSKAESGEITVLWIQTKAMVEDVHRTKPWLWQTDTTFGTNREGYKLHIPLHKSSVTGRFEVGGFLFLASENQEYVHKGLMFFKQSLTYTSHDIGQRFLFFVDKDFSYIEVIRVLFPGCIVLLDDVHVDRYFRDKVFPGAYYDDGSQPVNKQEILEHVKACRRAHSREAYLDNRTKLMRLTEQLNVKPGRVKSFVPFSDYFFTNWDPVAPMWVLAYRKELPLQGSGNTQACESFFRVLKMFEKQIFGHRRPSLHEMIPGISKAIDRRFLLRSILVGNKRIKYYHPDPIFYQALEEASWSLNPIGMKLFYENIQIYETRVEYMSFGEEGVIENYDQHGQKCYSTTEVVCSCSYYKQMFFCRHIIYFRIQVSLPVFDISIFHSSLVKNVRMADKENVPMDFPVFDEVSPPSPGIEMALTNNKKRSRNPTQAKKFNIALDIGRELAEIICTYDPETFDDVLETTKSYVKEVRRGMTQGLKNYLMSPDKFMIVPQLDSGNNSQVPNTLFTVRSQELNECQNSESNESVRQAVSTNYLATISHSSRHLESADCNLYTLPRQSDSPPSRHLQSADCNLYTPPRQSDSHLEAAESNLNTNLKQQGSRSPSHLKYVGGNYYSSPRQLEIPPSIEISPSQHFQSADCNLYTSPRQSDSPSSRHLQSADCNLYTSPRQSDSHLEAADSNLYTTLKQQGSRSSSHYSFPKQSVILPLNNQESVVSNLNSTSQNSDISPIQASIPSKAFPEPESDLCFRTPLGFRQVPVKHKHMFEEECLIKTIKPSGGCGYGAVAFRLFHDEDLGFRFRRSCHEFLVDTWSEGKYEQFMQYPLEILVVKGDATVRKYLNSTLEYHKFLASDESLTSYSESDVEVRNMCNMMNISIFLFSCSSNFEKWNVFHPEVEIVKKSRVAFPVNLEENQVFLYHEHQSHFEPIVPKSTILGSHAQTATSTTSLTTSRFDTTTPQSDNCIISRMPNRSCMSPLTTDSCNPRQSISPPTSTQQPESCNPFNNPRQLFSTLPVASQFAYFNPTQQPNPFTSTKSDDCNSRHILRQSLSSTTNTPKVSSCNNNNIHRPPNNNSSASPPFDLSFSPSNMSKPATCKENRKIKKTFFNKNSSKIDFQPLNNDDLPDIPTTIRASVVDEIELMQFLSVPKSKGRPAIKRQPRAYKKSTKFIDAEILEKLPAKISVEDFSKQRKPRSDKGLKRGSYKLNGKEQNSQSSFSTSVSQKQPRAPLTMEALRREHGLLGRPTQCITCHFPLDYEVTDVNDSEKVVNCRKCQSFIHKSCEKNCGQCDSD